MPTTTLEGIVGSFQVTDPWPQDFREICENINVRKRPRHSYFINLFCWQDWLLIMNLMENKKKEQTDPGEWWLFYCFVHLVFTCMLNISPQFFSFFFNHIPRLPFENVLCTLSFLIFPTTFLQTAIDGDQWTICQFSWSHLATESFVNFSKIGECPLTFLQDMFSCFIIQRIHTLHTTSAQTSWNLRKKKPSLNILGICS